MHEALSPTASVSTDAKRILVAPIPVTPTKPFTPSHLKGMLWVDVMLKTTGTIAQTDCLYSNLTANACEQTLGFWAFLDREHGGADYRGASEEEIGDLYVRYHRQAEKPPYCALKPCFHAVERDNWIHPASAALHRAWSAQAALLNTRTTSFTSDYSDAMPLEELLDRLKAKDLCIDLRADGGGVYLDLTADGLPLRSVITPNGRANYLILLLRDLVPRIASYDCIVLLYDYELSSDYLLLQRILTRLGAVAQRVSISRVAIDGVVRSSRFGGWKGYLASDLIAACIDGCDPRSFQLGMRLYFIAGTGKGMPRTFSMKHLRRAIRRAHHLIHTEQSADAAAFLRNCRRSEDYLDPYLVTSLLLANGPARPPLTGKSAHWYM
ncbi:hypothetical protein GJW-30_1_03637 [Variibacter gotjawalensis]|uniref:Uncharacterized protein n=1 Tax=Variibacter gotjawalensis TaxID=1333996 RepID=A0A0S3PYW2_9BRAD|nr:hypothetical protein [Variibacter gotjawalensis]NIK46923.1 hypothetical protein [Variibacter gotjawalensis]RZS48827.1 hypothetical protein EV661_1244 [Variibacter gotjawalensis]BAT61086.1 hypothetical protein GJW-30_1_03637 [Variibacter gotjawalensis]